MMTKNEWSLMQLFTKWMRQDMARLESQVALMEELLSKLKPEGIEDGDTEQPKGD